ncbi:MAG: tRNA (N6-isopentenyl adenosine(37)-C2)-methylthiotransferase MiaB [bacterium]
MPNYFIKTLGCQMNKNDSERIAGFLRSLGMKQSESPKQADLIIINTCSVRQSAEDRVFGLVRNWKELRKSNPNLVISITGCMAGCDQAGKLKARLKVVDLLFKIDELDKLAKYLRSRGFVVNNGCSEPRQSNNEYLNIAPIRDNKFHSFITIQIGCNNFCSYCVVPYARGREYNRPVSEILREVKESVESGVIAITLLGQVINHYKAPDKENFSLNNPFLQDDFAALLWEVNQIDGLQRIHFTAPHPLYFSELQIQALCLPKQTNYLHLPVQSGDNDILKKMNRKHTVEQYIDLIDKIKKARPGIALGTDLIVGFPGESEQQFQNTIKLYKKCEFDISYTAMYSPRSNTVADKAFDDDVLKTEKRKRWMVLQELMEQMTLKKNQKYVGMELAVMVEKHKNGMCFGQSPDMKLVEFKGSKSNVGKMVKVKINEAGMWILRGKM